MADTVFTKIRKGEIPGHVLYEDAVCFAILTVQPNHPGHVLIIPIAEIADWEDLPHDTWLHLMEIAQMFGKIIKKLYGPPKVALASVGFEVPHAHIHVFSLFEIEDMANIHPDTAKPEDLLKEATKIKAELQKK